MGVSRQQRFNVRQSRPCPICGGGEDLAQGHGERCYGYLGSDGRYVHCTRENYAGDLTLYKDGTYIHRLGDTCQCGRSHASVGAALNPEPNVGKAYQTKVEQEPDVRVVTGRIRFDWDQPIDYTYRLSDGQPFAIKRRINGVDEAGQPQKTFRWFRFVGNDIPDDTKLQDIIKRSEGAYVKGMSTSTFIPLYRIERLVSAPVTCPVWIVEGEKSVHAMEDRGLFAVCSPHGGNRWDAPVALFQDRRVRIIPDNDGKGKKFMGGVAKEIFPVTFYVKIVTLPVVERGDDVVDWFNEGGTLEELEQLAQDAAVWESSTTRAFRRAAVARRRQLERKRQSGE